MKAFPFSAAWWAAPFIVLACHGAMAQVQPSSPGNLADPSNPRAAEPPVPYRSVFKSPVDPSKSATADAAQERADWKKANAEVGQFPRGHADILKWEAQQAASPAAPVPAPKSATPTSPPRHNH